MDEVTQDKMVIAFERFAKGRRLQNSVFNFITWLEEEGYNICKVIK